MIKMEDLEYKTEERDRNNYFNAIDMELKARPLGDQYTVVYM